MSRYDEVMSLSLRKGFLWPAVDLYGGFAGFYDYGHNGALLKRRWEDLWLDFFLGLNDRYYLIDTTTILPEASLKASGHVDHFVDVLVPCTRCGETYRGDRLLADATGVSREGLAPDAVDGTIAELGLRCPACKGALGPAQPLNLMFRLAVGPRGKDTAYLRPETAQGVFLNFRREFEALRRRLPMGLAAIGRAYRNEISPRQGAYRLREFLQAELQIFFHPARFAEEVPFPDVAATTLRVAMAEERDSDAVPAVQAEDLVDRGLPSWFVYHMAKVQEFYVDAMGLPLARFRFAEIPEAERAHYNRIQFDVQIRQDSLGGFREVAGVHYRTDYDLKGHQTHSKQRLEVTVDGERVLPHVLELSFGVDRSLWALLDIAYEKEERDLLRLPPRLAPIAVAVFPLVGKDGLPERARRIHANLRGRFQSFYDARSSIGRRYARMDEIGTPFCVTVDHATLQDGTVTVRERDTTEQKRVAEGDLVGVLDDLLRGRSFDDVPGSLAAK
jgi:glycyl-tRNA synthetase